MDKKYIGHKISAIRKEKGLTQNMRQFLLCCCRELDTVVCYEVGQGAIMKLLYEKVDAKHFITLGYDTYCKSYIAHQTDGANDWYYKISEELYLLFDTDRIRYSEQIEKIIGLREKSLQFYFSYLHNGNDNCALNDLYYWREVCLGKTPKDIHKHVGVPNTVIENEDILEELYIMDIVKKNRITVFYKGGICTDIIL